MADNHIQYVLQYMIAHGCVKEDVLRAKLKEIANSNGESNVDDERVSQMIQYANKKLKRFNMMIRGSMDEVTVERYYVLISTVDNEITHAATQYSAKQYEFFKFIFQAIVHDPRGIITDPTLKSLAEKATIPTIGKSRASLAEHKILFNEWCSRNWFLMVTEGEHVFITLGVRSMAELDVFIKNKLIEKPDDVDCKSCGAMAIYSVSCPKCDSRFHKRCSKLSIDPETGSCKMCLRNSFSQPRPSTSSQGNRSRRTTAKKRLNTQS